MFKHKDCREHKKAEKMVVKRSSPAKVNLKTLIKYKLLPQFAYEVCYICHVRLGVLDIPCEIQYRSKDVIKCNQMIPMCEHCFTPNSVFTCLAHSSQVNAVYCDFTGQGYEDSPVYYMFPELGIRRVTDAVCVQCNKNYVVCAVHQHNSPIKYENCARCLQHTFWDAVYVHGCRELKL